MPGVIAAKEEIGRLGLSIEVGFNAVVSFSPADLLWLTLAEKGNTQFWDSLDFVGLDFFPDVFRPLPTKPDGNQLTIEEATVAVLSHFRNVNLAQAKIPSAIPIHITENGWATSPTRKEEKQDTVLLQTISAIVKISDQMNITHYEYFALRDADSSSSELQFGLLRDNYSPKPAFHTFCNLIKRYGK